MIQGLALASVLVLLAGCDAYPTEDAPLLDEGAMSVPQLLQALNQVGARGHLQARYRHGLLDGCVLELQADDDAPLQVPLDGADITTRLTGDEPPAHEVLVYAFAQPRGEAEPVVIQQGGRWIDWVQTRSLLQQLQRRCAEAVELRNPSGSDPR